MNITRVIDHWSLPLALVIRVLDFLHYNMTKLRRKQHSFTILYIHLTEKLTNLGLPYTLVLGVGNGWGTPLTIFFIIPLLRLRKKKIPIKSNK